MHLADELDTSFSKYLHLKDALAVSSLTMAMLARIEGGPPCIMVALLISKGLVGPQPTTLTSPRGIRDSTYFGRWVAQQILNDLNFRFTILIRNHVCRTFWVPIYVVRNFVLSDLRFFYYGADTKGLVRQNVDTMEKDLVRRHRRSKIRKWEAPFYRKWEGTQLWRYWFPPWIHTAFLRLEEKRLPFWFFFSNSNWFHIEFQFCHVEVFLVQYVCRTHNGMWIHNEPWRLPSYHHVPLPP